MNISKRTIRSMEKIVSYLLDNLDEGGDYEATKDDRDTRDHIYLHAKQLEAFIDEAQGNSTEQNAIEPGALEMLVSRIHELNDIAEACPKDLQEHLLEYTEDDRTNEVSRAVDAVLDLVTMLVYQTNLTEYEVFTEARNYTGQTYKESEGHYEINPQLLRRN